MNENKSSILKEIDFEKDACIDIVLNDLNGANKEQILHSLAKESAPYLPVSEENLYRQINAQEHIASSGTGEGVAIPALKLSEISETKAIFTRLERPVDFNAVDGKPVDLICLFCSPKDKGPTYLRRLSRISRLFRNKKLCDKIRETSDTQSIKNLVHNPEGWMLAA